MLKMYKSYIGGTAPNIQCVNLRHLLIPYLPLRCPDSSLAKTAKVDGSYTSTSEDTPALLSLSLRLAVDRLSAFRISMRTNIRPFGSNIGVVNIYRVLHAYNRSNMIKFLTLVTASLVATIASQPKYVDASTFKLLRRSSSWPRKTTSSVFMRWCSSTIDDVSDDEAGSSIRSYFLAHYLKLRCLLKQQRIASWDRRGDESRNARWSPLSVCYDNRAADTEVHLSSIEVVLHQEGQEVTSDQRWQ